MQSTLILLAIVINSSIFGPDDRKAVVRDVNKAWDAVETLSFAATVRIKYDSPTKKSIEDAELRLSVKMKRGGHSRIDAYKLNSLAWIVTCDGVETTEWLADENLWTTYPAAKRVGNHDGPIRQLLVTRNMAPLIPVKFGTCWLDPGSAERVWYDNIITSDVVKRLKNRTIDGMQCIGFRYVMKSVHPDGPLHGKMNETFELFLNSKTLLPVREVTKVSGGPLGISVMSGLREITYSDIILNPPLDGDTFSFTPPRNATFIAHDDPRFAPPPQLEGKIAPAFSLSAIDGTTSKLNVHQGKRPVLLVFWATWCGPCSQEIPFLRELRSEHSTDALAILAVSSEPKMEDIARFAQKKNMTYQVLHDSKKEVSKAYQVNAIPRTILIDRSGRILKIWKGWSGEEEAKEIRAEIKKLLE